MISLRELCEKCNVSRRVIQGYEKVKLISPCSKNNRGYLLYDDSTVERVMKIRLYQRFGFQIKEIKEVFLCSNEILKEELIKKEKILLEEKESLNETIEQIQLLIETL